jgi:hypothetical protein
MSEYQIERLSDSNLTALQTLYRLVYRKTVTLEVLRGKYDTRSFGATWIGFLAFTAKHEPAAFYGVIPCYFKFDDEILLAAQSADTMTSPIHQKKGLFIELAKRTYALAKAEGIKFIFGFPNQNSYPGFKKLQWQFQPLPLQTFIFKGSAIPWARMLLQIPIVRTAYTQITSFKDMAENAPIPSHSVGIVRDRRFLQYKNQYTRTCIKQWDTQLIWFKNDGALKVGLLITTSPTNAIGAFLQKLAENMGCSSIILMTSAQTPLYEELKKIASPTTGLPVGFLNLTDQLIEFNKAKFDYCDIDIF